MTAEQLLAVADSVITRGDRPTPALLNMLTDAATSLREHAAYLVTLSGRLSHCASIIYDEINPEQEEAV